MLLLHLSSVSRAYSIRKMTEIFSNDTINGTESELDCGDFPDLEKMKVKIIEKIH